MVRGLNIFKKIWKPSQNFMC